MQTHYYKFRTTSDNYLLLREDLQNSKMLCIGLVELPGAPREHWTVCELL